MMRQTNPDKWIILSWHIINKYLEIWFIKIIGDIPSNLAILPAFLYNCMEEGEHKHNWRERWMRTFHQSSRRDLEVGVAHIEFKSIRRLSYNLKMMRITKSTYLFDIWNKQLVLKDFVTVQIKVHTLFSFYLKWALQYANGEGLCRFSGQP